MTLFSKDENKVKILCPEDDVVRSGGRLSEIKWSSDGALKTEMELASRGMKDSRGRHGRDRGYEPRQA